MNVPFLQNEKLSILYRIHYLFLRVLAYWRFLYSRFCRHLRSRRINKPTNILSSNIFLISSFAMEIEDTTRETQVKRRAKRRTTRKRKVKRSAERRWQGNARRGYEWKEDNIDTRESKGAKNNETSGCKNDKEQRSTKRWNVTWNVRWPCLVWKVEWPQCTPQMYIGVRFRKSGQIFKIWPGGYIYDPPKCQIYPPHRECFFDKNWKIFQIYTSIETALRVLLCHV